MIWPAHQTRGFPIVATKAAGQSELRSIVNWRLMRLCGDFGSGFVTVQTGSNGMKVAPNFSPDIAIQSVVDRQSSLGGYRLSLSINELDGNSRKKLLAP